MRSCGAIGELRGDLKRRRDRLGEDRDLVGQRVGNRVQVALRHRDQVGERAVVIQDAEHRAVRAVRVQAPAAGLARPARAVDLADDAAAGQRPGFGDADELMAEHAAEAHVALDQLEVGLADAGAASPARALRRHPDWGLAWTPEPITRSSSTMARIPRTLSESSSVITNLPPRNACLNGMHAFPFSRRRHCSCAIAFLRLRGCSAQSSPGPHRPRPTRRNSSIDAERTQACAEGRQGRSRGPCGDAADGRRTSRRRGLDARPGRQRIHAARSRQRPADDPADAHPGRLRRPLPLRGRRLPGRQRRPSSPPGLGRRDEQPPTDMIMIALDPRHDHQTGYVFQTNPSGWQGDLSTTDDDRNDRDYNAVWEVRTEVTEHGLDRRVPDSVLADALHARHPSRARCGASTCSGRFAG